jgi:hypothetical protein
MRRLVTLGLGAVLTLANTGCIINQYDSDPNLRMRQLLNHSEDLRQIRGEWHRFWMNDMLSHLTPARLDGQISPSGG